MLKRWWFWSVVIFLILEAGMLYITVYHFSRNWEYFPFNQEDAIGFITIPLAMAFIPFIVRNMRKGGVIPVESDLGILLLRFSAIPAIIGVALFLGLNFGLEQYDYHFVSVSALLFGLMLSGVLTTLVKQKVPETPIGQPPNHIRWIFIIIILLLNIAMFMNINSHPFWIYALGMIAAFSIYRQIVKRFQ